MLAGSKRLFDLTDAEFASRLSAVRRALYLLFNEGYHGASGESAVRVELCNEALRLTALLLEHPPAATPETSALAALMSLHAARLPARVDAAGELSPLAEQDRSRWDARLVAQGLALLERSAAGDRLTTYHLEAAIAAAHAGAPNVEETDWASIVSLYDRLMAVAPSPVVALNRAIAVAQRDGPERGLEGSQAIDDRERLASYPFYPAALGELELRRGDTAAAREHFSAALAARAQPDRAALPREAGAGLWRTGPP